MSKAIRSYPEWKRQEVVNRRLNQKIYGLGYLAARDYQARTAVKRLIAQIAKEKEIANAS